LYILGISCFYHDSAACLLKDGLIIAAAEEERFSRKKHDFSFPAKAVNFCLEKACITSLDIDHVVFYEKPLIKFERLLYTFLSTYPHSYNVFLKSMPIWLKEKLHIGDIIKKELKYKGKILFVTHHQSHASSAFLASGYKDAAMENLKLAVRLSPTNELAKNLLSSVPISAPNPLPNAFRFAMSEGFYSITFSEFFNLVISLFCKSSRAKSI